MHNATTGADCWALGMTTPARLYADVAPPAQHQVIPRASRESVYMPYRDIIAMQHAVGNRVVARMLGRDSSAFAGGNALLDLAVRDVHLEAPAAQLLEIGVDLTLLLTPVVRLISLAKLAWLKFRGDATLSAVAKASVEVGADANIEAIANSLV